MGVISGVLEPKPGCRALRSGRRRPRNPVGNERQPSPQAAEPRDLDAAASWRPRPAHRTALGLLLRLSRPACGDRAPTNEKSGG